MKKKKSSCILSFLHEHLFIPDTHVVITDSIGNREKSLAALQPGLLCDLLNRKIELNNKDKPFKLFIVPGTESTVNAVKNYILLYNQKNHIKVSYISMPYSASLQIYFIPCRYIQLRGSAW